MGHSVYIYIFCKLNLKESVYNCTNLSVIFSVPDSRTGSDADHIMDQLLGDIRSGFPERRLGEIYRRSKSRPDQDDIDMFSNRFEDLKQRNQTAMKRHSDPTMFSKLENINKSDERLNVKSRRARFLDESTGDEIIGFLQNPGESFGSTDDFLLERVPLRRSGRRKRGDILNGEVQTRERIGSSPPPVALPTPEEDVELSEKQKLKSKINDWMLQNEKEQKRDRELQLKMLKRQQMNGTIPSIGENTEGNALRKTQDGLPENTCEKNTQTPRMTRSSISRQNDNFTQKILNLLNSSSNTQKSFERSKLYHSTREISSKKHELENKAKDDTEINSSSEKENALLEKKEVHSDSNSGNEQYKTFSNLNQLGHFDRFASSRKTQRRLKLKEMRLEAENVIKLPSPTKCDTENTISSNSSQSSEKTLVKGAEDIIKTSSPIICEKENTAKTDLLHFSEISPIKKVENVVQPSSSINSENGSISKTDSLQASEEIALMKDSKSNFELNSAESGQICDSSDLQSDDIAKSEIRRGSCASSVSCTSIERLDSSLFNRNRNTSLRSRQSRLARRIDSLSTPVTSPVDEEKHVLGDNRTDEATETAKTKNGPMLNEAFQATQDTSGENPDIREDLSAPDNNAKSNSPDNNNNTNNGKNVKNDTQTPKMNGHITHKVTISTESRKTSVKSAPTQNSKTTAAPSSANKKTNVTSSIIKTTQNVKVHQTIQRPRYENVTISRTIQRPKYENVTINGKLNKSPKLSPSNIPSPSLSKKPNGNNKDLKPKTVLNGNLERTRKDSSSQSSSVSSVCSLSTNVKLVKDQQGQSRNLNKTGNGEKITIHHNGNIKFIKDKKDLSRATPKITTNTSVISKGSIEKKDKNINTRKKI